MMVYCTYLDVQLNLQYLVLKADSKPSIADVTVFCEQLSVEIEGCLTIGGIILPVTDPDKLSVLKKIAVDGVTARVFRSFNTEQALANAKAYQGEYDKAVENIKSNPGFIDTAKLNASPGYYKVKDNQTRKYSREERNW